MAVTMTGLFFAEQKGAISLIIQNDKSYLALAIMGLFVSISAYVGSLAYHADVAKDEQKKQLIDKSNIGWFCAEHFFSLGLLGTIIGLVLATGGSLDGAKPVSEIVDGLKKGLNTAFFTTICGIVFSLLLQLQLLVLQSGLRR
tara:strand:- start:137 stop:565 length:429 start_codon:yes stop_codon:yes gene_type:complete